jgi:CBS domain-containing protein
MKTARELLQVKRPGIVSVSPEDTVYEALEVMAERHIGAVLVMEASQMVGVLSERDYARKVALNNRNSRETKVKEIMTAKVICIGPERTVDECMALMSERHIRHLPVLDGDTVIGLLSMRDLVQDTISEQRFLIEQLELYIRS